MSNNVINSLAILRELQHDLYEIARHAELGDMSSLDIIQSKSQQSLRLIDSVMLSSMVESGQTKLQLQPIGAGSVMHEVAHELRLLSGQPVSVKVKANYSVTTSKELFLGFLYCLGGFVKTATDKPMIITSYDAGQKVGIGVLVKNFEVNSKELATALETMEMSSMPLSQHSSSGGVMLLLASRIAENLGTKLYVTKKGGYKGFAFDLPKSQQLSLEMAG